MSTSISKLESKSGWKETGLQTADISSMFTWIAIKASPICYLALVTSDSYQLPVNSLINIQTHAEIILSDFLCSLNTLYVRPLQVLTVAAFAISSKGNITFFFFFVFYVDISNFILSMTLKIFPPDYRNGKTGNSLGLWSPQIHCHS